MKVEEVKNLQPGDKLSVLFDVHCWNSFVKREIQEYFKKSGRDYLVFKEIHCRWEWCAAVEEGNWALSYSHIELYKPKLWSYERDY